MQTYESMLLSCAEFNAKLWDERRTLAWPYYVAADLLVRTIGPLKQAGDESAAALGCAFANWTVLKNGWCECKHDHGAASDECFWHSPDTSSHGWMCPQCKGMTQVG